MDNETRLSIAYSDLKDKHVTLKLKYSFKKREIKLLNQKYLELCKRYAEENDFLNKLLKEKWFVRGLTEEEKAFMLKM
ncbi:hypothetical protein SAMN05660909_05661 [Chitinophaga terrae (ex Kim and Jung 2007)]|uniref:Uncharacterized protein n=1 Tax=Chitinophaga terrae (ex Kim and Jung 2007) TaxID=408074 RepID=A0A1H4GTH0_9BACT|nr:hypothetical protein [Chitinophaga terrae (ex Kim and Jung 2007)]GEP93708.1 hypothetical protein CTE07_53530 [Chitinophaga terrae (ex Kim and Jung 2007)]SEB12340.1 hypothetical protein SAMN05660909_05661 [Chitinophaga terrae (ex Kim and Jung 2007)]